MQLIRRVRIQGMRSIEDQTLDEWGHLTSVVGKNSSGKSNALRALNLFFNGSIDSNKLLVFARDHFDRVPRSKKKKRIVIEVEFSLPSNFRVRKELAGIQALGKSFWIARSWELDRLRNPLEKIWVASTDGTRVADSEDLARQFLSLISYRYIPNRSIPSAILRDESQEIANSIFMRMRGDAHASALMGGLVTAAEGMLQSASDSLQVVGAPIKSPRVSTPSTLGEMLKMTGFVAEGLHGGSVQDEEWGSGHQAFFLYQVLYSLDTNYGRFFGWRQATIWGVEEPESALHRDLESRLALQLRTWSHREEAKLQIIQTTHSATFAMASDVGYWTELENGATKLTPMPIPSLSRAAELEGISHWVHPVLSFSWNPVVLVEGHVDSEALSHAASIAGLEHLRFLTIPKFDVDENAQGKNALIDYAKRYSKLIQNRPPDAPLILLFDWEVSDQDIKKAQAAYGSNSDVYVQRMNSQHCGQLLGQDFRGIERFYPSDLVKAAHDAGEITLGIRAGEPYSVSPTQLKRAKQQLLNRLKTERSQTKLEPLIRILKDLEAAVVQGNAAQRRLPGV